MCDNLLLLGTQGGAGGASTREGTCPGFPGTKGKGLPQLVLMQ
jgi:hypothetical protein